MSKCMWLVSILFLYCSASLCQPIDADLIFAEPDNSRFKISPNGKLVSVLVKNEDDQIIRFIDVDNNRTSFIARLGLDAQLNKYIWLSDSILYFDATYKINGVRVPLIGTIKNNKLFFHKLDTKGYIVDSLLDEPGRIMFAKNRSQWSMNSKYYDLYIINLDDFVKDNFENAQEIKHDSNKVGYFAFDNRFKRIITSEYSEVDKVVTIKSIPIEGGEWRKLFELRDEEYRIEPYGFINKQTLFVLANKNTDKMVLREFDIESQTLGKILYQHPKYDLTTANFTSAGVLHYVTYSEHGLVKYHYFDKGSEKFSKQLANTFKNQDAYFIDNSRDNKLRILYVNGSIEPGEYYIYDAKLNHLKRLSAAYYDLVDKYQFSPSKTILVKSRDGTELEGFLTVPHGFNNSTLLVIPHGGPIGIKENDRFNKEVQYYVSRGFSVLRVNFRGSSGFGKEFKEQAIGEFGRLIEQDITAVVDEVVKTHSFEHRCSVGASYGGYSAAMLAIIHPDEYDCVVGAFGIYDLPLLFNSSNYRSGKKYREIVAKTVGEYSLSMKEFSPLYLYKKLRAPILLIAGKKDDIADFEHTNRFNYILKSTGHTVETMYYKNAGHGHANWNGDKHEAAITSDFIVRSLNLELPQVSKLDVAGRKAIGNDFARIADGYSSDSNIESDSEKAYQYYKLAAKYKHARATFNIGSYYHQGKNVEKDMDKAVEYYRKAGKLGYTKAYSRLGRMYMEGDYLPQDWNLAHKNLKIAQELNPEFFNNIRLARFFCTAPQLKDFDKCWELLDLNQYKKHSASQYAKAKKLVRTELAWIIIESKLTKNENRMLADYAKDLFELTEVSASVEYERFGAFEFKISNRYGDKGSYELTQEDKKLTIVDVDTARFGLIFEVDLPGLNTKRDRTAIIVRWTKTGVLGESRHLENSLLYGTLDGEWKLLRSFKQIKAGEKWTLKIFDLNQNQIFKKELLMTK